jgi:NitT/TauT family transport system ATP-binding protein
VELRIESVSKSFTAGDHRVDVLQDLSLTVRPGEFVSLVGPSGCGKSTLFNLLTGLTRPSAGQLLLDGSAIDQAAGRIGYITQQDNLLPWRTLLANTEIALELRGVPRLERRDRAREWLNRVGLSRFERYFPHQVSGGMRKRVTLIRTLIYDPEILLMDEPFSALDAQTKIVIEDDLLELWEATRKTILFVTHDLSEAIALSDRVLLMTARPGRIKSEHDIKLPRPRKVSAAQYTHEYVEIYQMIWNHLEGEVRKGLLHEREEQHDGRRPRERATPQPL